MRISFFKIPNHRVFDHQPIYWDEAKEKREEREKRIKEDLGMLEDGEERDYAARIRAGFRSGHKIKSHFEVRRREKRKSNIRLIIILIILILLAQYLVKSGQEWYTQFFAK